MTQKTLHYGSVRLQGSLIVPGDKSVSHRSIMFGAMATGTTTVEGFLLGEDCLDTIKCFRKLGVNIDVQATNVTIESPGINNWEEPSEVLYTGNSGTTMRLMLGVLAGSHIHAIMTGDASIAKRPMRRVVDPLRLMQADIRGRNNGQYTPLAIQGKPLQAIDYTMPVASAQVKSAILLAGLHATGTTIVREAVVSRDHTERMLRQFGVAVTTKDGAVHLTGNQPLQATHVKVPGDISSAAFFLVAGAIVPNSEITLQNVGLNPTRDGIIDVLQAMKVKLAITDVTEDAEPTATLTVQTSEMQATIIGGDVIPRLIDEIPILALLATQAHGTTIIKDAEELKVKETDRIQAVVTELKKLGATIEATEDGMVITGPTPLHGANLASYGDHRIGMMGAIAALIAEGEVTIDDTACIGISYPTFFEHIEQLAKSLS
ncbi:MAG TPA: 3-phosphoshikimate 1-carboxyvinyltransferase [Metalysinibacillus jejuensis]|uniref:3-phosphoshikimate 1-carboxyvinyltransferase n=1 Tax=Metalysinibacillus jejuensis TaxID=914327 RepID=A0A921T5R8_9BACL|nr:3-phosphoshikimate 1-carboxyvinyltransferase [Metalysinibacillus jejuensis]